MSDYIYIVNLSIYLHKYLCISPIERYLYIFFYPLHFGDTEWK